ncbi:hypothetical protein ACWF76_17605 [Streptomyces globisporus]
MAADRGPLVACGVGLYDGDLDQQGSAWAREREEERRAAALRNHAAWAEQQRGKRDELHAELWVSAPAGRAADPGGGIAGRAGPQRGPGTARRAGECG